MSVFMMGAAGSGGGGIINREGNANFASASTIGGNGFVQNITFSINIPIEYSNGFGVFSVINQSTDHIGGYTDTDNDTSLTTFNLNGIDISASVFTLLQTSTNKDAVFVMPFGGNSGVVDFVFGVEQPDNLSHNFNLFGYMTNASEVNIHYESASTFDTSPHTLSEPAGLPEFYTSLIYMTRRN